MICNLEKSEHHFMTSSFVHRSIQLSHLIRFTNENMINSHQCHRVAKAKIVQRDEKDQVINN